MKKTHISLMMLILFGVVFNNIALSWDNRTTHMQLSEYAAENSVLDKNKGDYLKNLGVDDALDTRFKWSIERSVKKWLANGADLEDAGNYWDAITGKARYTNHFHNPLKQWNSAGLSDLQSGESSLKWAQDSAKQSVSIGEDWSWQKIRDHYYNALTKTTDAERQVYFAQTFRGLGHQMHLIQDAAQPAHVRNDAHPMDGAGWEEGLETWAKSKSGIINYFASTPTFSQVDLNITYDDYVPITQFIDTKQYIGSLIPDTSLAWGLSEYTNSNFVSDDTIFTENFSQSNKHYFPYPRYTPEAYEMYEIDIPPDKKRIYLRKKGDGENIEHFATAGPLYKYLSFDPVTQRDELKLDREVNRDYASLLIPRAVGYSAGLLNYFFRGDVYLMSDFEIGYGYVIVNNADEDMDGTFELWYDNMSDERVKITSWNISLGKKSSGNNRSSNISFIKPSDAKEECKYIFVFRGQMGQEQDAVVGKMLY